MKLKRLDVPPVWFVGALIVAFVQARYYPAGLSLGGGAVDLIAGLLVGGGIILMVLAVAALRRHKTTIDPHREADALVTGGIFKRSRNPIYLGDLMILAGLILYWDAVPSLVLVPIMVWITERRFIVPEENGLRRKFRAEFAAYCQKTRRWL